MFDFMESEWEDPSRKDWGHSGANNPLVIIAA